MTPATAEALIELNRRFYDERADAFAAHRKGPWPGFSRVLAALPDGPVLDVGCGDGRFGVALARMRPGATWIGVDASRPLLDRARHRSDLPARRSLVTLDVARHPDALPQGPLAGAVALGLLHHVPTEARRTSLLRAMAGRLGPGGILAATFWRFRRADRLRRLELGPEAWARYGVDPTDVEPGDALLSFGGDEDGAPRYCHFASDEEIDRLDAAVGLPLHARYRADGREGELNEYLVWERPA